MNLIWDMRIDIIATVGLGIAVAALFVRLGKLIEALSAVQRDFTAVSRTVDSIQLLVAELKAWRESGQHTLEGLTARVTRLEDKALEDKK